MLFFVRNCGFFMRELSVKIGGNGKNMRRKKILYGGDYNPEQWLKEPEILEKDIAYMKEARINTVSMGMFSWAMLEPEEGQYRMGWLEERIEQLYRNGIFTILSTPSGARPRWLAQAYPEVLRVREDRVRQIFGERHNHCYTSPMYREKVGRMNRELAKRFGKHPAVVMWHVSNEYGGECHCPLCQEAFREWLERKYGTVEALNDAWCTTFWSRRYSSFAQAESPSSIGEWELHGLTLDWKRFVTAQTADFARHEIAALKEEGITQPTTVNLMYDYQQLNYDELAKCVDVVSWDSYPVWHEGEDIVPALDQAMQHDYMRCLKHKPYLLMESCPSSLNWQRVSKLKRPGLLTASGLQAIAHGSDSVMYFQIRQSRGASEKFHGAVIDHYGGTDTRVFQEVKAIGEVLETLEEIKGAAVKADVAVIYDVENRWAMEDAQGPRNDGLFYHEAAMKSYTAFKRLGLNVDVISQAQEIEGYRMVAAPMLYLFRDGMEEKIRHFVAGGGCFVLTYWSGVVDETDRCFLGKTPHGLTDVFGLRRAEIDGLYDGEVNGLVLAKDAAKILGKDDLAEENGRDDLVREKGKGDLAEEKGTAFADRDFRVKGYECRNLCELLEVEDAQVLFTYASAFYQGSPAVTVKAFGKGKACYVAADAKQRFYDDFYAWLAGQEEVCPILEGEIPAEVEVSSRTAGEWEYVLVQNFSDREVDIRGLNFGDDIEILYGRGDLERLQAYGSVIMKRKMEGEIS